MKYNVHLLLTPLLLLSIISTFNYSPLSSRETAEADKDERNGGVTRGWWWLETGEFINKHGISLTACFRWPGGVGGGQAAAMMRCLDGMRTGNHTEGCLQRPTCCHVTSRLLAGAWAAWQVRGCLAVSSAVPTPHTPHPHTHPYTPTSTPAPALHGWPELVGLWTFTCLPSGSCLDKSASKQNQDLYSRYTHTHAPIYLPLGRWYFY